MVSENFKTLIVANPQSANASLGRKWPRLREIIQRSFGPFDYRFTERQGDAPRLARLAIEEGYEMVVAMGGDGTISEVADGFFADGNPVNPEAVLGVLPFGTGGDFRKTILAPKQLEAGAAGLRGRSTRPLDVGRLTYTVEGGGEGVQHFVNIASFGIGGLVDEFVNSTTKIFGGRVSFLIATLRASLRYRTQHATLQLDDQEPRQVAFYSLAVANGKYFGGGMHMAPHALLDDGLFDVITMGHMSLLDILLRGTRIYKGTHLELPQVSMDRASVVRAIPVDPGERILLDVDGEVPGILPATFELLPGAIRLKTPTR